MRWDNPFYVVCENLTVNFEDPNHGEFIYTKNGETHIEKHSFDIDLYAAEDAYFIECLRTNKETFCPVSEGFKSFAFVSAVIDSAKSRKVVDLT